MDIALLTWLNTLVLMAVALISIFEIRKIAEALRGVATAVVRIEETAARTEQMTARILTEISTRGAQH